jgi:ABC-type uncharacterized transport system ATPase subunit
LTVHDLSLKRADPFGDLSHIDLMQVCAGEVVGIAGVSGNGQGELLFGRCRAKTPGHQSGAVLMAVSAHGMHWCLPLRGKVHDMGHMSPAARRKLGLHFVPEERLGRGAVPLLGLAQNLLLTRREAVSPGTGWLNLGKLRTQAEGIIERYKVKASGRMRRPNRCPGAICKSSLWAARSRPTPACSSSASPPGVWMWALPPRFAAKF